jgi:hypothetical protein
VLPSLFGRNVKFGVTQAYYGASPELRRLFGSGFAPQFGNANHHRLTSFIVWSAPLPVKPDPCTGLLLAVPVSAPAEMSWYAPQN